MHRKGIRLTVLILRLFFSLFIVAINTLVQREISFLGLPVTAVPLFVFRF